VNLLICNHLVQTIDAKGRIVIHCNVTDELWCKRIINNLNVTDYSLELNGKLTDSKTSLKIVCIICCLSKNYEKDSKRQSELQYAFKSQYRLVPILIEHDFKVQQPWLRYIVDSLVISTIDFSRYSCTFSDACQQLRRELAKFANNNDESIVNAFNYLNIYQECHKQGWDEIPKLLFHIPAVLFHDAIDKRQPNDMTRMISLMSMLNDGSNGRAQTQIDCFQQWLTFMNQTNQANRNIKNEDSENQPQVLHNSQEYHTHIKEKRVYCFRIYCSVN